MKIITNVKNQGRRNDPLLAEFGGKTTITLCRCEKSYTRPNCDNTCKHRFQINSIRNQSY